MNTGHLKRIEYTFLTALLLAICVMWLAPDTLALEMANVLLVVTGVYAAVKILKSFFD